MTGIKMQPLAGAISGEWAVPGSKSITNRALVLAALRDGTTVVKGVLHSDDTVHMRNALTALGIEIEETGDCELTVRGGVSRLSAPGKELFIGNSGTTVRFLSAFCCLVPGDVTLVGDEHMAKRPIKDLIVALEQMGVEVDCPTGCPPITIKGTGLPGGQVSMRGNKSSQYFSALMLSGGHGAADLKIKIEGTLVSVPYVKMTKTMVEAFGGSVEHNEEENWILVRKIEPKAHEETFEYIVEPDASSASYPFALAAATGSTIKVPNLNADSMQGDFEFTSVLKQMGCSVTVEKDATTVTGPAQGEKLKGIEVDMHHISDTVMSLAAIAPLCDGPVTIKNVANIRIKETDRLAATVAELERLGQQVEHGEDWMKITPVLPVTAAEIQCYSDHRMAMSFAILGKAVEGVTITDPSCTAKTYPNFFKDLDALCASAQPSAKKTKTNE